MSDDKKTAEAESKKEESTSKETPQQPKMYEESYVKELIAERDKAKAKAREIAEKEKKEAEAKAIEEGKIKEILALREAELAEARKTLDAVEAAKQARRKELLEKITDQSVKEFAEKLSTPEEIDKFVALVSEKKLTTHKSNDKKTAPEAPKFTSLREMQRAQEGGGLIPKL